MKYFLAAIVIILTINTANASSMFDDSGNFSGNWKQMTNINTSSYNPKYRSSDYSSSNWYANNKRQQTINKTQSYTNKNYIEASSIPFRYNSLDYTRNRKVQGGHGESYSARCHDIGDVSFCR